MSNEQDNTAIVAIVIALIAFFATTAQLLQAVFGTAEGYRRCQASVIGPWAKLTRRVWRWSEFRFETLFTTPHISLQPMDGGVPVACDSFIEGTPSSRRETYCDGIYKDRVVRRTWRRDGTLRTMKRGTTGSERADDLVSWLGLVNMLHRLQASYPLHEQSAIGRPPAGMMACLMDCPAVTFRTRSWDFMPPEIVRPFATSNVGDIIALAHRLGMRWKDIRPGDGIMRAEGNGQSITSTTVRGFGLLLQYTFDLSIVRIQTGIGSGDTLILTIPSREADMLGFQITPRTYGVPRFVFGDPIGPNTITRAMSQLGLDREVQDMYVEYFRKSKRLYGFSDLIGMVTCFLPLQGSSIVQIFSPYPEAHDSPTNWWEGFVVYHARLLKCVEGQIKTGDHSEQMKWVLDRFEYMRSTYPWNQCPSWEAESRNNETKNGRSIAFLNDLRNIWLAAEDYFRTLSSKFRYRDLVGAHIAQAVYYPDLAEANIKAGTDKRYELGAGRSQRVAEGMHIYVDQIPKVVDFMKEKGFDDEKVVREAWWTLILKAMCWHRSVALMEFQPSNAVPPSFHESQIPVYIA